MSPERVFIHGLESSSRGTKGLFFRERFPDMIIENFPGSFAQRMEKLESILAGKQDLILTGSSFGGLMAATYAFLHEEQVRKLVLLAPALHLPFFEPWLDRQISIPVAIFHGSYDDVVPLEDVRAIAAHCFPNHRFNIVEDGHTLQNTFLTLDWDALLDNRNSV